MTDTITDEREDIEKLAYPDGRPTNAQIVESENILSFVRNGADILTTDFPAPVWIVPDLLPAGLTILAGRPKIGKSWLALQIAFAVAAGGRVFDQPIERGRVLFLALEDNERRLQLRMKQQGWTRGAAEQTDFVTMETFRRKIGALHKDGGARLFGLVQSGNYKLVVIDTMSRAFMGVKDMDNSQEVTAALSPLQEMAITSEFGLLILDHHTKPKGTNPSPIDDISGSTAKAAVLDTAMGLYKDTDTNAMRLLAQGRDIEQTDFVLNFDAVTGCWQKEADTKLYIKNEAERQIIAVLQEVGTADLTTIAQAVNAPKSHTSTRLSELTEKGHVEKIKDSKGKTLAYRGVNI